MPAARGDSGDQDRGGQHWHQDERAREPRAWLRDAGLVPCGRQIGQQPAQVTAGTRGQGLRHPLIELRLVEAALAEVLAELGYHRVPFGVGYPQVRADIPAGSAGLAGPPWPPRNGSCCILPGLIHAKHLASVCAGWSGTITRFNLKRSRYATIFPCHDIVGGWMNVR